MLGNICLELCGFVRFESAEQIADNAAIPLAMKPTDLILRRRRFRLALIDNSSIATVAAWYLAKVKYTPVRGSRSTFLIQRRSTSFEA